MDPSLKNAHLFFMSFIGLMLFCLYLFVPPEFDKDWIFFSSILPTGYYFFFCLTRVLSGEKFAYFSIFNLFCWGFILVHFQFGILSHFHEELAENDFIWNFRSVSTKAVIIGAIGFMAFLVGYTFRFERPGPRQAPKPESAFGPKEIGKVFRLVFMATLGAFAVFTLFVGASFFTGIYVGGVNWGGGSHYYFLAFEMLFHIALILEIYRMRMENSSRSLIAYLMGFNKLLVVFGVAYFLFQSYIGDRGPMIKMVLIVLGGYDFYFRRLGTKYFLPLAVSGVVVLAFVARYRTNDSSLSLKERIDKAQIQSEESRYYDYTSDLAASIRTLNMSVGAVPDIYPYFNGRIMGGGLLKIFPFAERILKIRIDLSAAFNTLLINGPGTQIGTGTTIVADCYLDAGIFTVVLLMFLLGYFQNWLEKTAAENVGIYHMIIFLTTLSFCVYWSRAALLANLNVTVWSIGFIWFLRNKVFLNISLWPGRRLRRHLGYGH